MRTIHAVDLFCGAGGTSTGLAEACLSLGVKVDLVAINHWETAVQTHTANHPWAKHLCQNVESVDPRVAVPGGHLNLLVASPECTHFSRAAGGRPKQDQKRASAWQILRWLELLKVDAVLVENVQEFQNWGPLDGRGNPIKKRKGEIFQQWVSSIRAFGYTVDARVLNAADYGAPTSRSRLFVQARRGNAAVTWPRPTHGRKWRGRKKWRAAREIIDWSLKGESIFNRKKALSPRTLARIREGLWRFGGPELRPFLVLMEHGGGVGDLEKPLPTITATKGGAMALVEPEAFILSQGSGGAPRSIKDPVATIPTKGAHALIVPMFGERRGQKFRVQSVEDPLAAVTSHGAGGVVQASVEPVLIRFNGTPDSASEDTKRAFRNSGKSVDDPLPAVTSGGRFGIARPFLLPVRGFFGENTPKSVDEPLGTITQRGYGGVVDYVVRFNKGESAKSLDDPLPALQTRDHLGLVRGCLVQYNGQSEAQSVEDPLPTVTTKDRIGLVQPVVNGRVLDIRFRMLQPGELAGAMGFPSGYKFSGNKTEIVKQIGNAVAVDVARSLARSLLTPARGTLA